MIPTTTTMTTASCAHCKRPEQIRDWIQLSDTTMIYPLWFEEGTSQLQHRVTDWATCRVENAQSYHNLTALHDQQQPPHHHHLDHHRRHQYTHRRPHNDSLRCRYAFNQDIRGYMRTTMILSLDGFEWLPLNTTQWSEIVGRLGLTPQQDTVEMVDSLPRPHVCFTKPGHKVALTMRYVFFVIYGYMATWFEDTEPGFSAYNYQPLKGSWHYSCMHLITTPSVRHDLMREVACMYESQ